MTRLTWDEAWMGLAGIMSMRSRCPTGAGCVIVDTQQRVVSTGYAGPPAGWQGADNLDDEAACTVYCRRMRALADDEPSRRDYRDCPSSHAEMNALMFADRSRTEGGTLYVSSSPCVACVKAVANSGVRRVAWRAVPSIDERRDPGFAIQFLAAECGIEVSIL